MERKNHSWLKYQRCILNWYRNKDNSKEQSLKPNKKVLKPNKKVLSFVTLKKKGGGEGKKNHNFYKMINVINALPQKSCDSWELKFLNNWHLLQCPTNTHELDPGTEKLNSCTNRYWNEPLSGLAFGFALFKKKTKEFYFQGSTG